MADDVGLPLANLIGNDAQLGKVKLEKYVSDDVGLPTLQDILSELKKPGRDPREAFEPPAFRADVTEPKHLSEGMELEGVVTNIVAFGAFVDVGVHQDGLVHVSQLADRYVSDPIQVVAVGQKVKVRVMSVDLERNRIALTMKSGVADGGARRAAAPQGAKGASGKPMPKAPVAAPRIPKSGEVAANGMRFK
jgi:uncharacterized protein